MLVAASCQSPCPQASTQILAPMTEERGHQIDPGATTGLAVSTTEIFGDCRVPFMPMETDPCAGSLVCVERRSPFLVIADPVNMSFSLTSTCGGDYALAEVTARASLVQRASSAGEAVLRLPAGRYTVYLSRDDRCAACGIEGQGEGCVIDVVDGHLTPRDLVLDRSTR
jgi:hypothetical protein